LFIKEKKRKKKAEILLWRIAREFREVLMLSEAWERAGGAGGGGGTF